MTQLTQEHRLISLSTPLGKDKLLLTSFDGSEHISDLFEFQLEALSDDLAIKPDTLIGKTVTVTIQNEHNRTFNGYVSRFSFGEIQADNLRQYRLTMVPWLWFLSKMHDHRIFQEKSAKDIICQIFKDAGFNDFKFNASGGTEIREYCVQYNETDLNFVSRLLEEEGIAYYFEQSAEKHTLVIVDQKNSYKPCVENEITYSKGNQPGTQISSWDHWYEFITGLWEHTDYDFKNPRKKLNTKISTSIKLPLVSQFEHYQYPGNYSKDAVGKDYIKYRLEAEEANFDTVLGESDCSTFFAGGTFKLKKHDARDEKGGYIITSISHKALDSSYFSGKEGQSEYINKFICIPDNVHFRPLERHPKPIIQGPLSALVTGPSGEEIYIDEYGRIKVQFFWDREGKVDENSSCFIRVVQPWAGRQWGTSFIPRMGMEVIVDFINGNPDRPLVTGSVYNKNNMPPYSSKTQSGIKTHSTKGGDPGNYNEIRFEDLKGSEQVFIHAEKNMDVEVENDETLTVDNDRTKLISHDENSTITNDRNKTVNNNQTETIAKNKSIDVGVDHTESIENNMTIRVGGDLKESVKGQYNEDVTKEYGLQAKTITMQADDQITLQTGGAKIVMKKNGDITISGKNINLKGSGNVVLKGSKVTSN